ncbi:hypothetical protein K461DRAFT_279855 [Myriangium duriaei CBS 260.36]|uniref:SGF29 C-terminal domain-containing protein n=1 Tax=Myriangium duriaei CBS 260.36 TaxID=1168546 RepID=A0A9P4J093_9PEZI|nr:hypothetical protein K461DRAFT_279855 [Myriangium duriaei CBS 260.36]
MSRTRQPRTNHSQDADEERRLWTQIKAEAKKIDTLIAKSGSIGNEIVEIEKQQALLVEADKPSDATLDDRLETLYREDVRLSEQIQHMIEGQSEGMSLLDTIRILQALRENADDNAPLSVSMARSASATNGASKSRSATAVAKRKAAATTDDGDDSAAPSPRVSGGRLTAGPGRDKSSARGGSAAPSIREASVKIEDAESVASSDHGGAPSKAGSEAGSLTLTTGGKDGKGPPSTAASTGSGTPLTPTAMSTAQRLGLTMGAMVFYRNKGRAAEGEGILCRVTSVIGEGKQRRYEIQDADPDPQPGTGELPAPYRASVNNLIPIPTSNVGLSDLGKGKNVLAQYPDTTTFYKAEVSTTWRAKDVNADRGAFVKLRFEGEVDDIKDTQVERRFVIPDVK